MDDGVKAALFEQTILPHLNSAYNLARWLTRNEHDAEDVVQEAYLRAYRFFDSFQGADGSAWLLTVVRNTYLTWVRQRKGDMGMSAFDERTHRSGRVESLRSCVESLPVDYREVVVMRELEEISYREIADVAHLPIGAVMSRLARARKRLLECMTAQIQGAPNEVWNCSWPPRSLFGR